MSSSLDSFRLCQCPSYAYYIPNFISEQEEQQLLQRINEAPKPKWTQLKNRRLQNWGGIPHAKGMIAEPLPDWLTSYCTKLANYNIFESFVPNHVLITEYEAGQGLTYYLLLLSFFHSIYAKLTFMFIAGIMPHEDGPLYYPTVSTISLGSHTLLDFYKKPSVDEHEKENNRPCVFSLYLEPRSLVVLQQDMYATYLHGIKELNDDLIDSKFIWNFSHLDPSTLSALVEAKSAKRTTRISMTIRYVPKAIKLNLNSLLSNKKAK
jgi:alkylated DNA repair protein alkB family protein 6